MAIFEPWDVVKVPFPYINRPIRQYRPALVVVSEPIEGAHELLWVSMITSAENRRWNDDVTISDLKTAGLPAPSVVRCAKIATIDARDAAGIGHLPPANRQRVADFLSRVMAPVVAPRRSPPRRAARRS